MQPNEWVKSSHSFSNSNCVEVQWVKSSLSTYCNCVEVGQPLKKSSFSAGINQCVEAGPCACNGDILVRDTKDRDGGTLAFTIAEWKAFIAAAKAGEFDPA